MATLASLQDEYKEWSNKAQESVEDAARHRTNAANYSANGYADKAASETDAALVCDRKNLEYRAETERVHNEIEKVKSSAQEIKNKIADLQKDYIAITGSAESDF